MASDELASLAREVNAHHARARTSLKKYLDYAIKCGEALLKAKRRVGHGGWGAWVQKHCKFGARTASDYMLLALNAPAIRQHAADLQSIRAALEMLKPMSVGDDAEHVAMTPQAGKRVTVQTTSHPTVPRTIRYVPGDGVRITQHHVFRTTDRPAAPPQQALPAPMQHEEPQHEQREAPTQAGAEAIRRKEIIAADVLTVLETWRQRGAPDDDIRGGTHQALQNFDRPGLRQRH